MNLEFIPLASSSEGCAYLVKSGAYPPLLIDAGVALVDIQKATDFNVTGLAGCLVSHHHGDHSKAVPGLQKAGVNIYASPQTFVDLQRPSHRNHPIQLDLPYHVGPWIVRAFEAVHDAEGTYGFLIGSPCGAKLLYLTDSAYSLYRFEGLTHIAVECNFSRELMRTNVERGSLDKDRYKRTTTTHMSLERLIDMLKANDLSAVEEIHLLHLSDQNSDEEAFKLAVQEATGKPTYVAAKRAK